MHGGVGQSVMDTSLDATGVAKAKQARERARAGSPRGF